MQIVSVQTEHGRHRSGVSRPAFASANVVPMVECPAIGSSWPGVKIRIRRSAPGASAGRTKVLSEKFISRAMSCMSPSVGPSPSRNTASWLPVRHWSVKTS